MTKPEDAVADHEDAVADQETAGETTTPTGDRKRLLAALQPRATRAQFVVALLCGLLGFALVAQVRSHSGDGLATARQTDLVGILDSLTQRSDRLRTEIAQQQATLNKLTSGADRTKAALDDARERAKTLGILAGTAPAQGTGIALHIDQDSGEVTADMLLDAIQELRDAGAEAAQIEGAPQHGESQAPAVRLIASSYFVDSDGGGVMVDGVLLKAPYTLRVIGDPHTLAAAMRIPGGVLDTLRSKNASGTVTQLDLVKITALHSVSAPHHARPAPPQGSPGG
jgi:uncharacterized protein YlxW (UPF0749 family)